MVYFVSQSTHQSEGEISMVEIQIEVAQTATMRRNSMAVPSQVHLFANAREAEHIFFCSVRGNLS